MWLNALAYPMLMPTMLMPFMFPFWNRAVSDVSNTNTKDQSNADNVISSDLSRGYRTGPHPALLFEDVCNSRR